MKINKAKNEDRLLQGGTSEMDNQASNDEINLYDYWKIIYKWKFLIIAICLISVAATFINSSKRVPTTYKVASIIAPGSISTLDGRSVPIDSVKNIQSQISHGLLNKNIIKTLNLDPAQYSNIKFNANILQDTDLIRVTYDSSEPEKGKAIISELINQLSKSYGINFLSNQEEALKLIGKQKNILMMQQNKKARVQTAKFRIQNQKDRMQNQKDRLQNQKDTLQNQKETLQNQKELLRNKKNRIHNEQKLVEARAKLGQKKLELLIASEKKLDSALKSAQENMKVVVNEKDQLLKKGGLVDTVSLLFYSNTIQNAIYRIDNLSSRIESNKMEQEVVRNELINNHINLKNLDVDINDIDTQISDIAVNVRKLNIQAKDVDSQAKDIDSQAKDFMIQEKDIDIETLPYLKEIEDINKRMAKSSQAIKIVQEPEASINVVVSRIFQKVAVAGMLGLMIGIMLAFIIEYIKRAKANES